MRIMALGDSLTDGWTDYSNTSHGGYRLTLDAKLEAAGIFTDFVGSQHSGPFADNQHEGYPGQTIDWLTTKAHQVVPTYKPDMILLMAGANDTKTDSVATMLSDMSKLLDQLSHDAPNAKILVAPPPPPRPGNLTGHNVDVAIAFNKALPGLVATKVAAGEHLTFVSTSALTVNDISPIGPDRGTHLSQAGYEKLANIWFDAVKKAVGTGSTTTPPPDHAVVANDDTGSTVKNAAVTLKVLQNDSAPDGGLKMASVDGTSANGGKVVLNSDGTIVYTPKAGYTGTDTFKYVAKDADGDTDGAKVTVKVAAPATGDHPVVANDDSGATVKNAAVTLKVLQNDSAPDGGLKMASVDGTSANGGKVVLKSDGTIIYTPKAGYTGTDAFKYVAKDADGDTDGAKVTVKVAAPATTPPSDDHSSPGSNHPVVAKDDIYSIDAGKKLYFNTSHLLYNDAGKDGGLKATISSTTSANGVTLDKWADGTIVYKAPAGHSGTDKIDYVLKDKDGSIDTGSVFINVKGTAGGSTTPTPLSTDHSQPSAGTSGGQSSGGTNHPVTAVDDNYKIDGGHTLYFNTRFVSANDKGLDGGLNVVSVDAASERGVKISWGPEGSKADGTLVYKAQAGFDGVDKIKYTVADKDGSHDTGTILIHVHDLFH